MFAIALLLVDLLRFVTALAIDKGCTIKINGGLPDPQPLFLLPEGIKSTYGFLMPEGDSGVVNLAVGDRMLLACPGAHLPALGSGNQTAMATCCLGGKFCIAGKPYALEDLKCSRLPYHTARLSGDTCYDGTKIHLEIGFEVGTPNNFYKLIDVCFDDIRLTTLYTRHDIVSSIGSYQMSFPRPRFIPDKVFRDIPVNHAYTGKTQVETIGEILGSEELGHKYVNPEVGDYYMARGHLTAKVDFVYGAQHRATFHYINVAPQWQNFNAGNWNALESSVRRLASKRNLNLEVFTGTFGTATLPNIYNVSTELYLYRDENNNNVIPVPAFYWKVVYDPISLAGTALVGVNNPYLQVLSENYILCEDVCDEISWLSWEPKNKEKGYAYCCEVNEFRSKVDVLPYFPVIELIK